MTSDREKTAKAILNRRTMEGGLFPSAQEVLKRLSDTGKLRLYCGYDPTGDIHIGHLVSLLLLKALARDLGHEAVVLFGDFTARIGDPTGKESVRRVLSEEEIDANMSGWDGQVAKIFGDTPYTIKHNSDWLGSMTFGDVIKLSAKVTVQQMLARDMFQSRLKNDRPIHLNEFLYPLAQGYDSVAMQVDGEVGGSEQTFNMLVGREFSKEILGKDKIVLTTPLIINAKTGKKMSKSEGEIIAVSDLPQEIRRKVLDLDDGVTTSIFKLCTEKPQEWLDEHFDDDPRELKEELAAELIRMCYGSEAVEEAKEAVEVGPAGPILEVLKAAGAASTATAAKTLITQKSVHLNGKQVDRWDISVNGGDVLKVGKGKLFKVK
jgi:tyrosyl-tRNA synthetase